MATSTVAGDSPARLEDLVDALVGDAGDDGDVAQVHPRGPQRPSGDGGGDSERLLEGGELGAAVSQVADLVAVGRRHVDRLHGTVTIAAQAQEIKSVGRAIVAPKSDAGRRVVAIPVTLAAELQDHIDRYAQPGKDGFVFTGPAGTPPRRATLSAAWRAALVQVASRAGGGAEFPADLHIHDLRHHAATMMARTPGVTTKELISRIGHASPRASLLYQHATEERDRAVSDYLEVQIQAAKRPRLTRVVDLACDARAMEPRTESLTEGSHLP